MHRLYTMPHHLAQQADKQFGRQPAFISAIPEPTLGVHRRGRADRLPLTRALHHRGLSLQAPRPTMNRVSPKASLIPEEHLATFHCRLPRNRWIGLTLPPLDRFRIALIGP